MQLEVCLCRHPIEDVELRLNRRRIDMPHDLADVLLLPPQRAILGDLATGRDSCPQVVRQLHTLELRIRKLNEFFAQRLQRFYIAFLLAFAGAIVDIIGVKL